MRCIKIESGEGEAVMVYSKGRRIVLQVRRLVHGDTDPLAASFKSAVALTGEQAARVAAELLRAATDAATAQADRKAARPVTALKSAPVPPVPGSASGPDRVPFRENQSDPAQ